MARNDPVIKIDKLFGLRNTDRPERLPLGALTLAENVDVDDSLTLEIRESPVTLSGYAGLRYLYATEDQRRLFGVRGEDLTQFDAQLNAAVLASGLGAGDYHFTELDDWVFFAGPTQGIIRNGEVIPLAVPPPDTPAVVVLPGSGRLAAGLYQVTSVAQLPDGRESAAPAAAWVEVPEGAALRITAAPGPVYMTPVNGEIFYRAFESTGGPVDVGEIENWSIPLEPEQYQRGGVPPGVEVIEFHDGRLFAARGDTVFFSEVYWPHLFGPQDYFCLHGAVRVLKSTREGLFIATDRALYVYTAEESLVKLAGIGVPRGYPAVRDAESRTVYCLTHEGVMAFPPLTALTGDKYRFDSGQWASVSWVDNRGFRRLVITTQGQSNLGVNRYDR